MEGMIGDVDGVGWLRRGIVGCWPWCSPPYFLSTLGTLCQALRLLNTDTSHHITLHHIQRYLSAYPPHGLTDAG